MRKILKLSLAGLAAAALALACGNDNKSTGTTDAGTPDAGREVTLNGAVTILPQAAPSLGATTVDMTKFSILLIEPVTLLLNPGNITLATLGTGPVTAGTTAGSGTYSIPIDANRVTLAVVANVIDNGAGAAGAKVQTTTTGTGVNRTIPAGETTHTATAPAFIIPDTFATVIAGRVGTTPAAIGTSGYIVAMVLQGTTPLTGATVTVTDPNAYTGTPPVLTRTALDGVGATTGASGIVIITADKAVGSQPLNLSASATGLPACATTTSTGCIGRTQAGIQAGIAFVAPMATQ